MGISSGFDLDRDNEKFDKLELVLAERVISVLTEIFGNFMFKEMFSGGVLVKDGTVQFMSHPWKKLYDIDRKIKAELYVIGGASPIHVRRKYILDRFTSIYNIVLPTDGAVSDATITLSEIPVKFVLPTYKKPTDKSLYLDFYKTISNEIYKHTETLKHFKRETLRRSWRSQFYKTLMKICRDRQYNSLQLSLADQGFRYNIFSQIGRNDFRNKAFNWLTSRGEGIVTLTCLKKELKLSPADFRSYFKDDWAKFAFSLYLPGTPPNKDNLLKQMESDLRYMQDFITDTINFIFTLAESATNKKIILYPHNAYKDGYGVDLKNPYLPPKDDSLGEWSLSPSTSKKVGITLDLNDLDSIIKFVDKIPFLLGSLLVRPAAFIVRDPDFEGLSSDQCMFTFDMSGSLMPSQMVGTTQGYAVPPPSGMEWAGGIEADYKKYAFYLRWNKIISRHDILSVHKFNDPNIFFEIIRRILFTSIDDIAFYL